MAISYEDMSGHCILDFFDSCRCRQSWSHRSQVLPPLLVLVRFADFGVFLLVTIS